MSNPKATQGGNKGGKEKGSKHVLNKLSDRFVKNAKGPGRYSDGGGLYLQVGPTGGKSWLFRYMRDGKAREMGLGPLSAYALPKARDVAGECREQLADGKDPIAEREAERAAEALAKAKGKTFKACAEAYIKAHREGWKNAKHASQWENTLEEYAYPTIGDKAVADVDTELVIAVLDPIWKAKAETASRLRGRIESVLNWAKVRGYRTGENPARWRGHLDTLLAKRSKVAKVKHHPALPYAEIGAFVKLLREQDVLAAKALELIILTAARTSEVINARWGEFNLDAATWTIPAERMKAGKEHKVPLSPRVVAILNALGKGEKDAFVLPGVKEGKPLSNMACLKLLERMGRTDITVHGFRSTFRDWAAEQTAFPSFVAESALAHTIGDRVEAAYRRGDLMDKRRRLMDAWAERCDTVQTATVHNINQRKKAR